MGPTWARTAIDSGGLDVTTSETKLGGAFAIGYRMVSLDLRVGVSRYELGELADHMGLYAAAGFQLAAF